MILKFVEETIEDVLKLFKNSPVHQSQFKLHQLVEDDSLDKVHDVGYKLIHYHKIRWTSYRECVQRISALYDSLESYLRNASEDRAKTPAVRRQYANLFERLTDHKFVLYLLFLKDVLPILAIAIKIPLKKVNELILLKTRHTHFCNGSNTPARAAGGRKNATTHNRGEPFAPRKSRIGFHSHRECMEETHEYANELGKQGGKNPKKIPKFSINHERFSRTIEKNI